MNLLPVATELAFWQFSKCVLLGGPIFGLKGILFKHDRKCVNDSLGTENDEDSGSIEYLCRQRKYDTLEIHLLMTPPSNP